MKKKIEAKIETPSTSKINREYINDLLERANKDIDNGDFDSAITKSRTLLEEVFCYVIEKKGKKPVSNGNINQMYKQVKELYNMHNDKNIDKRINTLLSGLEKIITGITEMRNTNSDAHGVGENRITINNYHARLLVNSSAAMIEFIISVCKNNLQMS